MFTYLKRLHCFFSGITFALMFCASSFAEDTFFFQQSPLLQSDEFTPVVPVIGCDSPIFQFSRVIDGTLIEHTFYIKNDGDALLKILKVKTGCGCSTANFDTDIEPGKTGAIALKIDTGGYGGTIYEDEIILETNDPHTPVFKLKAKGPVDSLATLTPKGVSFKGKYSDIHKTIVSIEPNADYRFQITGIDQEKLKDKIKCTLEKQNDTYQLTILNLMKTPGRYWGKIILQTDHPKQKNIDLWISAALK